ncbi:PR domain zinc finger protein 5-like [Culicoides brevitarsis]|uniref:PR domain zinc finger protein 5-like n=1 Tax=Culicoides brevitarsis TaxID=469753 RepID=UPI00307B2CE8
MDKLLIKTEFIEENCLICLRTDIQLLTEHEVKAEILSLYKEFISNYVENLQEIQTKICFECVDTLNSILEFRSKCITSVQILTTKVYRQPVVMLEDISMKNLETIEIKSEIFAEELPIQVVPVTKKSLKSKKITKKALKSEEKKVRTSKKPQIGPYCYICCCSITQIRLHITQFHVIERENDKICCSLCLKPFPKLENLYEHQKTSHSEYESSKRCGKCEDFETKNREEYINHVHKVHFPDRKRIYPCDFCSAVYLEKVSIRSHVWQHLGGVKCQYCYETFFDMQKRQKHIEKHEKERETQYICDFCGQKSFSKAIIKAHLINLHVNVATIKCPKCDKLFKSKRHVTDHILGSHAEKSTICPHCGKKCSSPMSLKCHIYQKHNENRKPLKKAVRPETREFACDECEMKFYKNHTLKKHKFTHSKTRPYQCQMCSTGYYMNEYLRKHYLRVHDVTYSAKDIRKMCGFKLPGDSDPD